MKITPSASATILVACFAWAGCAPAPEASIETATVNAAHSAVRARNSSTSRTLTVLQPGEQVAILGQQDRWYRVRTGEIEGWMEVRTLVTDSMRTRIEEIRRSAEGRIPQNTGVLIQDANLRLDPGRTTSILRRLPSRTAVEVLERRTLPREDLPGRRDAWLKIRAQSSEVGWLLSGFVDFDVPPEIDRYTEDLVYTAVKPLKKVDDVVLGSINWYVVGERRPEAGPDLDFDGIRVFTWNAARQRYETAYRARGIRGVYPLEVGMDAGKPTFRVHELGEDGVTTIERNFVMNGVLVREVR